MRSCLSVSVLTCSGLPVELAQSFDIDARALSIVMDRACYTAKDTTEYFGFENTFCSSGDSILMCRPPTDSSLVDVKGRDIHHVCRASKATAICVSRHTSLNRRSCQTVSRESSTGGHRSSDSPFARALCTFVAFVNPIIFIVRYVVRYW